MSANSFPPLVDFQTQWMASQGTDLFNPEALQLEAALEFMQAYTASRRHTLGTETIPLESALGRVLNKDMIALMDVPPADNSAMDVLLIAKLSNKPIQLASKLLELA